MSENCTHDCSSCGENCPSRNQSKPDFRAQANPHSKVKHVIGVVSGSKQHLSRPRADYQGRYRTAEGGGGDDFRAAKWVSFYQFPYHPLAAF